MQKHAALYCRLSVDDGSFGGSVSIETQKILLEQYCQAHSITEYEFYCDDRYSGTNFNRPVPIRSKLCRSRTAGGAFQGTECAVHCGG